MIMTLLEYYTVLISSSVLLAYIDCIPSSNSYLLVEELRPFLLAPGATDLVGDQTIPKDSRGDMDTILPAEFDYGISMRIGSFMPMGNVNLPVYFKSSVTSTPPLGEDFREIRLRTASWLFPPITSAARAASFSRTCTGVRVEVGMSKNSP